MATMDIFNQDAFRMTELTAALNKNPYVPGLLGELNLFAARPVRTETIAVEERSGVLSLIQTSPRGAPLGQRQSEKRKIRDFRTSRIAKGDRITAAEVQGIRAFGSETELLQVQAEVARRMSGPAGLMREVEMTWENMRLGAIQGIVTDADGSTIYNFFTEFNIAQAAEVDFELDDAATDVLAKCKTVARNMMKAAKGAWTPQTRIGCLCDDVFYDSLTTHPKVLQYYLNWQAAQEARETAGAAYSMFRFGGIEFYNYRGTDDGTTIAIASGKAKFFPINAPGVFEVAYSPAETFEFANTPGLPVYGMVIPDKDRDMYVDVEVYSYPLFMCTRPDMLQRAKRA